MEGLRNNKLAEDLLHLKVTQDCGPALLGLLQALP